MTYRDLSLRKMKNLNDNFENERKCLTEDYVLRHCLRKHRLQGVSAL